MIRARKAPAVVPTLDNGMGDELLAIDYRETYARCIGLGCKPETAGARAAMRVVFKLADRAGHVVSQCNNATECAKCSTYGTVYPSTIDGAAGWLCTRDFSQRCES